jgi:RING finger/CHY zinc finger protein 1
MLGYHCEQSNGEKSNDNQSNGEQNTCSSIKCPHKNIKCKIISPCCGKKFMCGKCHDDYYSHKANSHNMDYTRIARVVCVKCEEYQDISNNCIKCKTKFAEYFCEKCKIFGDTSEIFHCDKCRACLSGAKNKFSHCDTCQCCIEKHIINTHKCIPNRMDRKCPICIDQMENGNAIKIMKCGHSLHEKCYLELIKNGYKCPECNKTIKNMKDEFSLLDFDIDRQPMPKIKIIKIKCNDCETASGANYHFLGTKCKNCGSYNTYES